MHKVIIIDDELLAQSIVTEFLQPHPDFEIVATCNNGFEGIKAINKLQPDLIFLDVQMPKINGFEMLELLEKTPAVIFTTAFDHYAVKAFETYAIDYLLKPFSQERFNKAINKWKQVPNQQSNTISDLIQNQVAENTNRLVVKDGSLVKIIAFIDVIYFEAFDDYVKVFTADNCYLKKKTMAYFEQVLNQQEFLRIHRSFIIQLSLVTGIEMTDKSNYAARLTNGSLIPLSRNGYQLLKEKLGIK